MTASDSSILPNYFFFQEIIDCQFRDSCVKKNVTAFGGCLWWCREKSPTIRIPLESCWLQLPIHYCFTEEQISGKPELDSRLCTGEIQSQQILEPTPQRAITICFPALVTWPWSGSQRLTYSVTYIAWQCYCFSLSKKIWKGIASP